MTQAEPQDSDLEQLGPREEIGEQVKAGNPWPHQVHHRVLSLEETMSLRLGLSVLLGLLRGTRCLQVSLLMERECVGGASLGMQSQERLIYTMKGDL